MTDLQAAYLARLQAMPPVEVPEPGEWWQDHRVITFEGLHACDELDEHGDAFMVALAHLDRRGVRACEKMREYADGTYAVTVTAAQLTAIVREGWHLKPAPSRTAPQLTLPYKDADDHAAHAAPGLSPVTAFNAADPEPKAPSVTAQEPEPSVPAPEPSPDMLDAVRKLVGTLPPGVHVTGRTMHID